jgi:hypothetical protein
LREAEVGEHRVPPIVEKHVGPLDVSVKKAHLMGVIECDGDLLDPAENLVSAWRWCCEHPSAQTSTCSARCHKHDTAVLTSTNATKSERVGRTVQCEHACRFADQGGQIGVPKERLHHHRLAAVCGPRHGTKATATNFDSTSMIIEYIEQQRGVETKHGRDRVHRVRERHGARAVVAHLSATGTKLSAGLPRYAAGERSRVQHGSHATVFPLGGEVKALISEARLDEREHKLNVRSKRVTCNLRRTNHEELYHGYTRASQQRTCPGSDCKEDGGAIHFQRENARACTRALRVRRNHETGDGVRNALRRAQRQAPKKDATGAVEV